MERCNTIEMPMCHANDFSYCIKLSNYGIYINSGHIIQPPHGEIASKSIDKWSETLLSNPKAAQKSPALQFEEHWRHILTTGVQASS
jgi:hypothetical protein